MKHGGVIGITIANVPRVNKAYVKQCVLKIADVPKAMIIPILGCVA